MIINNHSKITYSLGEETCLRKKSNIVGVKFINPIIYFIRCQNKDEVVVKIINNSYTTITNIIYRICSLSNSKCIKENIEINGDFYNKANNKYIYLGSLKMNDCIILKYKTDDKGFKSDTVLSYNIKIGDKKITMHITNNLLSVIKH